MKRPTPFLLVTNALSLVALCCFLVACGTKPPEPVAITFVDPEWSHDTSIRRDVMDKALQDFTKQTGIQVRHLPAPESVADQLKLTRQLLESGGADVFGIDVIWPGMLGDALLDLKPAFGSEMAREDGELVSNFTVQGRLVAVPFHANVGVLYYRTDLLRKYGFSHPPRSWDELEKMAARIQAGERAGGNRDFWGYLWPAAAGEGLTCDALEWQYTDGGGHIIEPDGKISVNNPQAIRSWKRAKHWIGAISPPAVLSYQEWDSINAFRYSQKAAFLRSWTSDYFLAHPVKTPVAGEEGVTAMPGGPHARAGTLGGFGLAVGRSSSHPAEALRLIRFLTESERKMAAEPPDARLPGQVEMLELPAILRASSHGPNPTEARRNSVIARPSTISAAKYDEVSRAYSRAVYAVISGKADANNAAAALEKELMTITGFPAAALPVN